MSKVSNGSATRMRIKDAILDYTKVHKYPPTIREICEMTGIKSTSSVNVHIDHMIIDKTLETDSKVTGAPRAIRVPGYDYVKCIPGKGMIKKEEPLDINDMISELENGDAREALFQYSSFKFKDIDKLVGLLRQLVDKEGG